MDAFIKRPLVRHQIPPPGFESSSIVGPTMMHTNNPFSFDHAIAPDPYSTAGSWSFFSGGHMVAAGRTHPFSSSGLDDIARAPICDDYFPRLDQFGASSSFPTTTVHHNCSLDPAVAELPTPTVRPPGGYDPTPVCHCGNPFDGGHMVADAGRIHPFSSGGLDHLARAPISLSDLRDDYFPRLAQFGASSSSFPTTTVHHNCRLLDPAVAELPTPTVRPPGGYDPTPVCHCGNPFDADGTATASRSVAMADVPPPWDRCYADGHAVVQPAGIEELAAGGGNSTRVVPRLCCLHEGYDEDIEATLRAQEDEDEALPYPKYLETTQGGRMSQDTRAALVGWMSRFAERYGLAAGTLHRAVSYADRFLSARPLADDDVGVAHRRLHVLGAAAVFAAAKYEDRGTEKLLNAAEVASYLDDDGFAPSSKDKEEVLDMERALLLALDYRLGAPTAHTFVEHFTRHYGGAEEEEARLLELRSCAHDFADMSLLHYGCLRHKPSAVAAAAMFLARLALKPTYGEMKRWNRELKELTGYEPIKLERCVEAIHSLIPQHGNGSYNDVDLFPMLYAIAADPK